MQFKYFALLTAAASASYAQTVSFNATEIIQDLMDLTNLAQIANSLAGSITLGNAGAMLPGLVTDLVGYGAELAADAVEIAQLASGSVFDVTDQVAICASLNQFVAADEALVGGIGNIANIITISPLNAVLTSAFNYAQACASGIFASLTPSLPNCATTGSL